MERIIIVDPQPAYWTELVNEAAKNNLQILSFSTFKAAQKSIANDPLLLVILHISIPDVNVIEATWMLKQRPEAPEVIIIADSANADDAEQAIRSGAWEYPIRPVNAKSVLPLIKREDASIT